MSFENEFEKQLFELNNNPNKPYFRHPESIFFKGQYLGKTYGEVSLINPEYIDWLISNYGLIIDLEEFEQMNLILTKISRKKLIENDELIQFNRKKKIIRTKWFNAQERTLLFLHDVSHFTKEIKHLLLNTIKGERGVSELIKIEKTLKCLGFSLNDLENVYKNFKSNPFNKYNESLIDFLLNSINYGCGEYFELTKINIGSEILNKIKAGELHQIIYIYSSKTFVSPNQTEVLKIENSNIKNSISPNQTEILEIEDKKFFIKNTNCGFKVDGKSVGKIYSISNFEEPLIVYNWFNFKSPIEVRVDLLLSIECQTQFY